MRTTLNRRYFLTSLILMTVLRPVRTLSAPPNAVQVIMLEEIGCRFCAKWDADIGRIYDSTPEGRFAPLVRVKRGAPELANLTKAATYTPTFIVMSGAREAGRITGYPGESYFWEELQEILTPLGFTTPADEDLSSTGTKP